MKLGNRIFPSRHEQTAADRRRRRVDRGRAVPGILEHAEVDDDVGIARVHFRPGGGQGSGAGKNQRV